MTAEGHCLGDISPSLASQIEDHQPFHPHNSPLCSHSAFSEMILDLDLSGEELAEREEGGTRRELRPYRTILKSGLINQDGASKSRCFEMRNSMKLQVPPPTLLPAPSASASITSVSAPSASASASPM